MTRSLQAHHAQPALTHGTASDDVAVHRFHLAGLEVQLQRRGPGALALFGDCGDYGHYPSTAEAPGLILDIDVQQGFWRNRPRGPEFPAFDCIGGDAGKLRVSRFDAEGTLTIPQSRSSPVVGQFRCGEFPITTEALIRLGSATTLPRHRAFIMHASVVSDHRGAHLFAGVSGAGKSTIAKLLVDHCNVEQLSDELVVIGQSPSGQFVAQVAPFIGSAGLPHGQIRPLASLNLLHQASRHRRVSLTPAQALRQLLRHVVSYVADPGTAGLVLNLAADLATAVPAFDLHFAKDPGVSEVLGIT